MINGNAHEFIDKLYYEDHYAIYNGDKYFFNGCQTKKDANGHIKNVLLEIYNLSINKIVFSTINLSATDCIEIFEETPIWNGKTFWEVENEIEWVDD